MKNKKEPPAPVDMFSSLWGMETKPQKPIREPGDLLKKLGAKKCSKRN